MNYNWKNIFFMPCHHKFRNELYLKNLGYKPETLIIGTFNPAWPKENCAEWFYGRTERNHLWEVLPRLYKQKSLKNQPQKWRGFCGQNKIAFTDLIETIKDADEKNVDDVELLSSYSDKAISKSFESFTFVKVQDILDDNPSIKYLYLTRGVGETFWKRQWTPIKNHAEKKKVRAKTLLTPSGYAYFQQGRYNKSHPENQLDLPSFILKKWQEHWHFDLSKE